MPLSDTTTRALLSILAMLSLMAFVTAIIFVPTLHLSDTMIGVVLGLLGSYVKDAYSFYFGTTAGSAQKDAIIAESRKP